VFSSIRSDARRAPSSSSDDSRNSGTIEHLRLNARTISSALIMTRRSGFTEDDGGYDTNNDADNFSRASSPSPSGDRHDARHGMVISFWIKI
jgi:hypothetical protein